jgi:hypothetical protein
MLALPGMPAPDLRARLEHAAPTLAKEAVRAGAGLRLAGAIDDDPTPAAAGARLVAPVHAVVELTAADDASLLDLAGALTSLLPTEVDWTASAVSLGTVHQVLPGTKSLLLVLGARRLPSITAAEFHTYWRGPHAELALSLLDADQRARMVYEQLHTDAGPAARAAELTGAGRHDYDGVLEIGLDQFLDLPHTTVPGFAQAIFEDEKHFADQDAEMRGGLLQVLHKEEQP